MEAPPQQTQYQQRGEGGPGQGSGRGGGRRPFRGTAENAKTQLCRRFAAGNCHFGDRCNFAHGEEELRPYMAGRGGRGYNNTYRGGYGGGRGRGYGAGYSAAGHNQEFNGGHRGGYYGQQQGHGQAQPTSQPQQQMRGPANPAGAQASNREDYQAPVEGPDGWTMYRVKETNEPYYHNARTQVTQWEKPKEWQ